MKPKTKSELMTEWANQPDQLKKEREVKAVRKAMDDARAVREWRFKPGAHGTQPGTPAKTKKGRLKNEQALH